MVAQKKIPAPGIMSDKFGIRFKMFPQSRINKVKSDFKCR